MFINQDYIRALRNNVGENTYYDRLIEYDSDIFDNYEKEVASYITNITGVESPEIIEDVPSWIQLPALMLIQYFVFIDNADETSRNILNSKFKTATEMLKAKTSKGINTSQFQGFALDNLYHREGLDNDL